MALAGRESVYIHMRHPRIQIGPWLWVAAIVLLLLLPLPFEAATWRWSVLAGDIEDFCHPLAFAWLAHIGYASGQVRQLRPLLRHAWVLAAAVALAIATEAVQHVTGRDASVRDLAGDLLGAVFALLLHARAESPSRPARATLAVLATSLGLAAVAPVAITFTALLQQRLIMPIVWKPDLLPFTGRLSHWQGGDYPGLVIDAPPSDWRNWQAIEFELINQGDEQLQVQVAIYDQRHDWREDDRFNDMHLLGPRRTEVMRIPLQSVRDAPTKRSMDLQSMRGVIVYRAAPGEPPGFDVREIRFIP